MDLKELALVLSPLVAVVVAIATIWFNAYDRRRHYAMEHERLQLEREKLAQDMAKALLTGTKSLERRIELYNELMLSVSIITQKAQTFLTAIAHKTDVTWDHDAILLELDRLMQKVRSSQVFTTEFVHKAITREYSVVIAKLSASMSSLSLQTGESQKDSAINLLTQIIAASDDLKVKVRDDLELFVRGLTRLPKPHAEASQETST